MTDGRDALLPEEVRVGSSHAGFNMYMGIASSI
jgi:hypothetical protein